MNISALIKPLNIVYPNPNKIPKNLLNTPVAADFKATSKLIPFREQYLNEKHPHTIKNIHYQYGKIKKRRAILFFYKKTPVKMVFSNNIDPYAKQLMEDFPPRVQFPPTTVSSPIARSLREFALKWIVDQFFSEKDYITFDEPILDTVNPDCLEVPATLGHKILQMSKDIDISKDTNNPSKIFTNSMMEIDLKDSFFVEIKAYHQTSIVGEKEVLQTYNYAIRGGKALLITTGTLSDLKALELLNDQDQHKDHDFSTGYVPEIYKNFVQTVKRNNRKLIKSINFKQGQDSYDTMGIYISASNKLEKMHKYTINWPAKIEYTKLATPDSILKFLHSDDKLGLIEPKAFHKLLLSYKLNKAAKLFTHIQKSLLEEIIINPALLYPN
nr:hypothetical protein [Candidatus Prometheoarchaeum syntrophicum]QEE16130.1 hypothetical protein DSAG12_01959 [Candidatus Prometheoarchaeum syntrophicum]